MQLHTAKAGAKPAKQPFLIKMLLGSTGKAGEAAKAIQKRKKKREMMLKETANG